MVAGIEMLSFCAPSSADSLRSKNSHPRDNRYNHHHGFHSCNNDRSERCLAYLDHAITANYQMHTIITDFESIEIFSLQKRFFPGAFRLAFRLPMPPGWSSPHPLARGTCVILYEPFMFQLRRQSKLRSPRKKSFLEGKNLN